MGKMQSLSRTRRDSLVGPNFSSSTNLPRPVLDERFDRDRFSSLLPSSSVASVRVAQYEEALKTLARELTNVKENERQKIAEQLHDQFGQDLVLAKMKLGQLLEKLPPQYIGCAEEIEEIIGELIHHTRAVINELYPGTALRDWPHGCSAIVSGRDTNETRNYLYGQNRFDAERIERRSPAGSIAGGARASLQCSQTCPRLSSQNRYDA